jgi:hypothetical protein
MKTLYEKEDFSGLETLYGKITRGLMFNEYVIDDTDNALMAFEAINNRGKTLTKLECFKNRLIYLTELYDEDELKTEPGRKVLRKDINDAWKEVYRQLGRKPDFPLNEDDFLRDHWILYFKPAKTWGNKCSDFLFNEKFTIENVRDKIFMIPAKATDSPPSDETEDDGTEGDETQASNSSSMVMKSHLLPTEIQEYVKSLEEMAKHWFYSFDPYVDSSGLSDDERMWLQKLNQIKMAKFRPLIMASLSMGNKENTADRVELYKAIERFIFLVFRVCGMRESRKESVFYGMASDLFNEKKSIDDVTTRIKEITDEEMTPGSVVEHLKKR